MKISGQTTEKAPGSFRDPSGFIFFHQGQPYRQINKIYKEHYDFFISSKLYEELSDKGLIIRHEEIENFKPFGDCYKIINPQKIPFISYPYEWCFSQLKDAALTTLKIEKIALRFGMTLKDSSAFNIQFLNGQPVLIDTLSLEKYTEGNPWVAYRQFCQHFLGPLALASYKDPRLIQLMRIFLDGIPLDLISLLLPRKTFLKFTLLSHLHIHAKAQKYYSDKPINKTGHFIRKESLLALIENLESTIEKLRLPMVKTEWGDYYSSTNYSSVALAEKRKIIEDFVDTIKPKNAWDLGANTGLFSRLLSDKGINTISFDIDYSAVEKNYQECVGQKEKNLLPLFLDLRNPSPAIGWGLGERMSLFERGPADLIMALALIHHLAIGNNLPLDNIARLFKKNCRALIVEFVPKEDSQAQILLSSREDIFRDYSQKNFEKIFSRHFSISKSAKIKDSSRTLYLMRVKK